MRQIQIRAGSVARIVPRHKSFGPSLLLCNGDYSLSSNDPPLLADIMQKKRGDASGLAGKMTNEKVRRFFGICSAFGKWDIESVW